MNPFSFFRAIPHKEEKWNSEAGGGEAVMKMDLHAFQHGNQFLKKYIDLNLQSYETQQMELP